MIIWFASLKSEQKSSFYFERWLRFIDCDCSNWPLLYTIWLIMWISDHFRFAMAHIGRVGSTLATLMDTIERFIAVVYPLRAIQKSTSLTLMRCCFVVAIIYNLPRFFEFHTIPLHEMGNTLPEKNNTSNQTVDKELSEVC
mgnify:CR=1 FL=1